ncbi:MAG: T9SS type A sorting domain-containing protein [Ignavibacteriaceae bacterium]|nr:T9SS type A sorting domain-containing protein [Ignavibacteriaceae bacterium]
MKKTAIIFFLLIPVFSILPQADSVISMATHVQRYISLLPDSAAANQNQYQTPSAEDSLTFYQCVKLLLDGSYAAALDSAGKIGYTVFRVTDNSYSATRVYYVLERVSGSRHWGVFIYNPTPQRPGLFIQAPHPLYDFNTGRQGFYVFKKSGAEAFYFSGTHRCNQTSYTNCDGTTTACVGGNQAYRLSDQAHTTVGPLQIATKAMLDNNAGLIVIQLHGFSKTDGDPHVIMGNGTKFTPSGTDHLIDLRDALYTLRDTLTFKVSHIDTSWTRLTGSVNTQGRLINGSSDPCDINPNSATGRFLHVEQMKEGMRDTETGWKIMADAVRMAFPIVTKTGGNWGTTTNWPGDILPDTVDNVKIAAGHTMTVNTATDKCFNLSFENSTSKIAFSGSGTLSVYGNVSPFSSSHDMISSWANGGVLKFTGGAKQTISGFGASSANYKTLMAVEIDKYKDSIKTDGTGMVLPLGSSLTVTRGTFYLASGDDIEGKSLDGSSSATPVITNATAGTFAMEGGESFIRSGNSGSAQTGAFTVNGTASLASASSTGINLASVSVESGGTLNLSSMGNANFNPGTLTVKAGGTVNNNSGGSFWNGSASLVLQSKSTCKVNTATTVFPSLFTNNGNIDYAMNGDQTIASISYSGLKVSGTGDKSFTQDLSVADSIELAGGNLTGGGFTITLGTSAASTGKMTRTSGRIIGNLKRWIAASVSSDILFPLGTAAFYRSVDLDFTSAPSTGGTLLSSFTASDPGDNGLPLDDGGTSITNSAADGYWIVTAGDGLAGGTYTMRLTAEGFSGINDYTTLRILKRSNGGSWSLDGSHLTGTGSNSVPVIRRSGLTGFSEFGIGSGNDNPLPVELSLFNASVKGNNVVLNWETQMELNSFSFQIERKRTEKENWENLGTVKASFNSSSPKTYSFSDKYLARGNYFYRLKMIDTDGSFEYSDVIKADISLPAGIVLYQNYPNPFNPSTSIKFIVNTASEISVNVYDVTGGLISEIAKGEYQPGTYDVRFDASGLAGGVYFYSVETGDSKEIKVMTLLK